MPQQTTKKKKPTKQAMAGAAYSAASAYAKKMARAVALLQLAIAYVEDGATCTGAQYASEAAGILMAAQQLKAMVFEQPARKGKK